MNARFAVALGPAPLNEFEGSGRNPFDVFDSALLSYASWRGRDRPEFAPEALLVGDSGGFSVAASGARLDAREVIRWQLANTDVGYILDIPPYRPSTSGVAEFAPERFEDSLILTRLNVRRAAPYYDPNGPGFRWWGVIQGRTPEEQARWWGGVAEVYPFDREGEGWAMRPYPNNDLASIARCVRFAADYGITRLHLLQTTSPVSVAVLLGLGRLAGLQFVSWDSQTPARLAVVRKSWRRPSVFPAYSLSPLAERSRDYGDNRLRDYMLSGDCPCVGCRWFQEDEIPQGAQYSHYVMLHNYFTLHNNFRAMEAEAARDAEGLIREAAGPVAGAVLRAFEGG